MSDVSDLPCAVCGGRVYAEKTHVHVSVETHRPDARDDVDDYYLHARCRDAVFGGWSEP